MFDGIAAIIPGEYLESRFRDILLIVYRNLSNANARGLFGRINETHAAYTAPTPIKLGAVNQQKPLTQTYKEFRKANGLCLYCGSKDHISHDCKQKKPITRINNSISLIKEGDTPIDLAAATPLSSTKRKFSTEFLEVGEIKLIVKSNYQSIMVIPITAYHGPNEEEATGTDALIDTGAIHNFVSLEWANYLGIPIEKLAPGHQRTYRLAGGTEYTCKAFCAMTFRLDNRHNNVETIVFHILETCSFHAILGMERLKRHKPLFCFQETSNHLKMNCLTTRCTPVEADTPSPAGLILSQPSVTTAVVTTPPSEDVEMARSPPETTAITSLRAFLVADRPPTPYPSSSTLQPSEENWYVNPAMLDTKWLPTTKAASYVWNDSAWVEQLFQQQLGLPPTQYEFIEDPSAFEPTAETEDEDDDQEVDQDDDEEVQLIYTVPRPRRTLNINQIRPNSNRMGRWTEPILNHYTFDDAQSIISLLAGRHYQVNEDHYPLTPPPTVAEEPVLPVDTVSPTGTPGDTTDDDQHSVDISETWVISTYNEFDLFEENNNADLSYLSCLSLFSMLSPKSDIHLSPDLVDISIVDKNDVDDKLQDPNMTKQSALLLDTSDLLSQTIPEHQLTVA